MKRARVIEVVADLLLGGLVFASFWIARTGLCAINGWEWWRWVLMFGPAAVVVIWFGKLSTLVQLLLYRLFGMYPPENQEEAFHYEVVVFMIVVSLAMTLFATARCLE